MSDILNLVNDAIFVSLVNTTLQITVLIPLIALFIWVFRIKSATTRYSLWLFALLAMVALPLLTPFVSQVDFTRFHHEKATGGGPNNMMLGMGASDAGELSEAGGSVPYTSAARVAANRGADVSLINPVSVAYFIWCAGALSVFCITIGVYRKLGKLKIDSSDVDNQTALEILSQLRDRLGIRRAVALKTSPKVHIPMSMGILSPVIIVPDGVIDDGASDQLEMILAHELAHIKRCDYLTRLLQNALKVVFFFHPLFYLMKRNLAGEREHICDDWVIETTKRRSRYAECLVDLLERAVYKPVSIPVTVAMAERKQDIPGRIDMIVDKTRKTATKVSRKALIVMLIIGCLSLPVIGGIELIRFASARPAPNAGQIVFMRNGIWVIDSDGRNERQISNGWSDGNPVVSPDGRQIAFNLRTDEEAGLDIYIMDADGSNVKRLTSSPENDYWSTWSPDGKQIAFHREIWKDGKYEDAAIYVINADGSNERRLTDSPPFFMNPDWSPDGTKITCHETHFQAQGAPKIWVMDADGNNQKMLNDWGEHPAWSPDGRTIAFVSSRAGWDAWQSFDIYVMDSDGANVEILTKPDPLSELWPAWSPDGTKIAFHSERDGNYDIYSMNADGTDVQRLTDSPKPEFCPDWAASLYAVESAGKLRSTWGKIKGLR